MYESTFVQRSCTAVHVHVHTFEGIILPCHKINTVRCTRTVQYESTFESTFVRKYESTFESTKQKSVDYQIRSAGNSLKASPSKTSNMARRYDSHTTTFSPDGRLFQVFYFALHLAPHGPLDSALRYS